MIDIQRYLLIAAIAALSVMLLVEWKNFDVSPNAPLAAAADIDNSPSEPTADLPSATVDGEVPAAHDNAAEAMPELPNSSGNNARYVTLQSDVLNLKIDLQGGDIVYAAMLEHKDGLESDDAFVLLENNQRRRFTAQSGLIGKNATDTADGRPRFRAAQDSLTLADGEDSVSIDLHYAYSDDITIIKRFTLTRGDYLIGMKYLIDNRSAEPFSAQLFGQLKRDNSTDPGVNSDGLFAMKPFIGVAYATSEDPYNKRPFQKLRDKPVKEEMNGGWIAIIQHYFVSAWVPDQAVSNRFNTVVTSNDMNIARFTSPATAVAPNTQGAINAAIYIGPKDQYRLEEISPGLELTVDYGWLWWIAQPLFWLLTNIHSVLATGAGRLLP